MNAPLAIFTHRFFSNDVATYYCCADLPGLLLKPKPPDITPNTVITHTHRVNQVQSFARAVFADGAMRVAVWR